MSAAYRILLAVGIIMVDFVLFFLPLAAFFLAYIILSNPPWFRKFLQDLDHAG